MDRNNPTGSSSVAYLSLAARLMPFAAFMLLVIIASVPLYLFGPVFNDSRVTSVSRSDDSVVVQGTMQLARNCRFVGWSATGTTPAGKVSLPIKYHQASASAGAKWSDGSHRWGPWQIDLSPATAAMSLSIVATHHCHPFWETQTEVASLPLIASARN